MIFSAVAEKIIASDGELVLDGECVKTSLQTVVLRRLEVFRGQVPELVTVQAGDLNGFYFSLHRRYLVFGSTRADKQIAVDGYGQTRELKDALDDVAYLRTYVSRSDSGEVFGYASRAVARLDERRMTIPRERPLTGTTISLSGQTTKQTRVDKAGTYRFQDVLPGDYTLEIHSGPNIVWGAKRKVNIPPKGCARVNFEELPYNPDTVKNSLQPDDLCPAKQR